MSGRRRACRIIIVPLFCALLALAACASDAPTLPPAASRATPAATAKPSVVYVALGASDAVGVGAANPNIEGYVPRIIARLPVGSQALNLGVNGYKVHDTLTYALPSAITAQPTLVTVWLVGNDFRGCTPLAQYAKDLDTLLGRLQTQTRARVFVANSPDMSQLPYFQRGAPEGGSCVQGLSMAQIHAMALQWNQTINPIVAAHGDVLVDLFHEALGSHPEYVSSDGFHPSSQGYAVLADLFWGQVTAHHAVSGT